MPDRHALVLLVALVAALLAGASPAPASAARGVLINSPGGTGSTYFGTLLSEAGVPVNSPLRRLKHTNPARLRAEGALYADNATMCIRCLARCRRPCHDRVIVVVGDPVHALASTARRWGAAAGFSHRRDMLRCAGCETAPASWTAAAQNASRAGPDAELAAIFASAAAAGRDVYGVQEHFDRWRAAQRDEPSAWPPILFTDLAAARENACALFGFVGASAAQRAALAARLRARDGAAGGGAEAEAARREETRALMSPAARAVYANLSAAVAATVAENYQRYSAMYGCDAPS